MSIRFPVEAAHILMFARAVHDPNPIYADEAYASTAEPGRIIAPPTFVQAHAHFDPDYRYRPKIGQPWFGSGRQPTGITTPAAAGAGTGLHAEQHFEYHKPIRPGDVLSVEVSEGSTWQKESRRAGTLTFTEYITEYRDQAGDVAVTARMVRVVTERPVEQ